MKLCKYCGHELEDEARFCLYCMQRQDPPLAIHIPLPLPAFSKQRVSSAARIMLTALMAFFGICWGSNLYAPGTPIAPPLSSLESDPESAPASSWVPVLSGEESAGKGSQREDAGSGAGSSSSSKADASGSSVSSKPGSSSDTSSSSSDSGSSSPSSKPSISNSSGSSVISNKPGNAVNSGANSSTSKPGGSSSDTATPKPAAEPTPKPAAHTHHFVDMGVQAMDWAYSGQEDTGPTNTKEKVSAVNACSGCGYFFGDGKDSDLFAERYYDHIWGPGSGGCNGAYLSMNVYAHYHLLQCSDPGCGIYKRGALAYYEYSMYLQGSGNPPTEFILTNEQIQELGLPMP